MVNKQDKQTYMSEFKSDWESYSYGLVPHLSKKLCKLLQQADFFDWLILMAC